VPDPVPVLLAGDQFVLNRLLAADLADPETWAPRELELPWPHVPFGAIAEVDEASGSEDLMIDALQGIRVCLTQMAPLTRRVLEVCPDLELFAVSRGGPVNANLAAATEHGVAVTFAPGRNATATAEYTVGLMLAAMPPGSVLVDCARGALLDHGALAEALRGGHLFAAGLDVFDVEPLPADHPLRGLPNVVLTPHLAGASRQVAERASRMVAAEADRWRRGSAPAHCANPDVLARPPAVTR